MPLKKLVFVPGINRENTNYGNEGGWYDCDKVRFRSGNPEKIGGWSRLSNNTFLGTARNLWNWVDFNGDDYLGIGTSLKYYIENGGVYNDVTPIFFTSVLLNPITATNGSSILTITDIGYHPSIGDTIIISGAVTLGGAETAVVLNNAFIVVGTPSGTTYTIDTGVVATAGDTGGGGATVTIQYEYPIGVDAQSTGMGWGVGPYGRGGYGSSYASTIATQLRLWSADNYGQDLVIAARGGAIYYWKDSTGLTVRAQSLGALATTAGYAGGYVPVATYQIIASAIQRFIIAMGSNPYTPGVPNSDFDPMIVRWSDQANPYQWVPAITNQSGEFRLTHGSYIMQSIVTRQETLIWTDSSLYSMQYLGPPYVWGFNLLMDGISILSPNSAISINNVSYWMGIDKFYTYSGRVDTLPCTVKQSVFEDLNFDQSNQVFVGGNSGYNEVWWFYCSAESNTIDRYVIFNYVDNVWYTGNMARSAWLDSSIRRYPMAADYNNRILYHESTVDDASGDTSVPITAYVQSSEVDIEDGHNFGFIWRMLPDVNFNGSKVDSPYVSITLTPRMNSGYPYGTAKSNVVNSQDNYLPPHSSVYIVQQFDGQVYTRIRGRQISFKISSDSLGVAWQLGAPRVDLRPDGRR
jgi:hypothetical protein